MFYLEEEESARRYLQWERELSEIEHRKVPQPMDATRAAVLRSCMRREQGGC